METKRGKAKEYCTMVVACVCELSVLTLLLPRTRRSRLIGDRGSGPRRGVNLLGPCVDEVLCRLGACSYLIRGKVNVFVLLLF
jgi:hypothetical protein